MKEIFDFLLKPTSLRVAIIIISLIGGWLTFSRRVSPKQTNMTFLGIVLLIIAGCLSGIFIGRKIYEQPKNQITVIQQLDVGER